MPVTLPPTEIPDSIDAVSFLSERTGLSKARVKDAMTKGAVWLESGGYTQRLRRAKKILATGDLVSFYYDEAILASEPPMPRLVTDGKTYSVWIKPAGLMSGGTRFGDHCAIDRVVERQLDRPTSLVHRLDRFVSGLMLLAHTKAAAANLSAQFQARSTTKIYEAVVHGRVDHPFVVTEPIDGKDAHSSIEPLTPGNDYSLVRVSILTGRKHQIRIHLAGSGHPVVGDRQHGSDNQADLQLAAVELSFDHPETGERITCEQPPDERPRLPL